MVIFTLHYTNIYYNIYLYYIVLHGKLSMFLARLRYQAFAHLFNKIFCAFFDKTDACYTITQTLISRGIVNLPSFCQSVLFEKTNELPNNLLSAMRYLSSMNTCSKYRRDTLSR